MIFEEHLAKVYRDYLELRLHTLTHEQLEELDSFITVLLQNDSNLTTDALELKKRLIGKGNRERRNG